MCFFYDLQMKVNIGIFSPALLAASCMKQIVKSTKLSFIQTDLFSSDISMLSSIVGSVDRSPWEQIIKDCQRDEKYRSRTCCIYNRNPHLSNAADDSTCPCGRLLRRHSFNGESVEQKALKKGTQNYQPPAEFPDDRTHSAAVPLNVFGQLPTNGCKFLRLDSRCKMIDLFTLLLHDCRQERPALILSVYGGAKYFTMTERLEKEFIRGVIDAATMAGNDEFSPKSRR